MTETHYSGWAEVYAARFGKTLTDLEHRSWESEIEHDVRDCREPEIIRALRDLGEEKRKGQARYNPTVETIVSRVLKNRWQDREDERHAMAGDCVCDGGWMLFCPEPDYPDYVASVPCACPKGLDVCRKLSRDPAEVSRIMADCAELRHNGITYAEGREQLHERINSFPTPPEWYEAGDYMRSLWKRLFGERVAEYEAVIPIEDDMSGMMASTASMVRRASRELANEKTDIPTGVPF